jgi:hypothetical protein
MATFAAWWKRLGRPGRIAVIVAAVFVGLVILGALVPSESDNGNEASPPPSAAQPAEGEPPPPPPPPPPPEEESLGIGDRLSLKGTSYKVTAATTAQAVGGEFTREEADGVFIVVTLTLTNEKDDPRTILADAVRIIGGNGNEYTVDTEACIAVENSLCVLEEIQPDLPKKLVAVYDVPPGAVNGAKLQASDLFSDDKGEINLGL